jgi:hypothetical protein
MAYTQDDLAKLKKAIATGAKKVRFGSGDSAHETEFRTLAEMKQIVADIEAEIGTGVTSRASYVEFWRD